MSDPALAILRSIDRRLAAVEKAIHAGQANDDGWTRKPELAITLSFNSKPTAKP
jgi:hypothetical protein